MKKKTTQRRSPKQVSWREGYRAKIKAEVAHRELERIRKLNGGALTAEIIVKEAKKKRSPLHPEVIREGETEAAEKWWAHRARNVMNAVRVVYHEAPKVKASYVHVVTEVKEAPKPQKVYRETRDILEDPVYRDQLLAEAFRELAAFRAKYAGLSELAAVFQAFDGLADAM